MFFPFHCNAGCGLPARTPGQISPNQPADIAKAFRISGSLIHHLLSEKQRCGRQKFSTLDNQTVQFSINQKTSHRITGVEYNGPNMQDVKSVISLSFLELMWGVFLLLPSCSFIIKVYLYSIRRKKKPNPQLYAIDERQKNILRTW